MDAFLILYVRHRPCVKVPGNFLELFLAWDASQNALRLPGVAVSRFLSRSVCETMYQIRDTWPDRTMGPLVKLVAIQSSAPNGPIRRTKDDILKDGTWCAFHDLAHQGGPLGPTKATYFGIPIDMTLDHTLMFAVRDIYEWYSANVAPVDIQNEPRVVYHGTARENVRSIVSEGLRPTFGMVGLAVYFGTFWKAFRFATRTQTYEKRPGAMLRYYAFWRRVQYKLPTDAPCACDKCQKLLRKRATTEEKAKNRLMAVFADHNRTWTQQNGYVYDAILVMPVVDGPIKNMECACVDDSLVLLDSIGHAESTTEHHEPFHRDLMIV